MSCLDATSYSCKQFVVSNHNVYMDSERLFLNAWPVAISNVITFVEKMLFAIDSLCAQKHRQTVKAIKRRISLYHHILCTIN